MIFYFFDLYTRRENDDLNIKLYGEKIPYETNPKFLGIVFDVKLNFEEHFKVVKKKVLDRINVLKVLSYDKTWGLGENFFNKHL